MKTLSTLAAASLIVLAGAASAQTPSPSPETAPPTAAPTRTEAPASSRGPMTRADFDALTDARMAAIQAGLKLNPEQQRLWASVEEALRARAALRADGFEEHRRTRAERGRGGDRSEADLDITQRLDRQAEMATRGAQRASDHAQRLSALAAAMKPFYASLDDNQKRLLPALMREGAPRGRGYAMHGRDGRGRMHQGMRDRHHGMDRGEMDRGGMGRGGMDRGGMGRGGSRYH